MSFNRYFSSRIVVARHGRLIRHQGYFCIHHNVLVFGKVNNHVRAFDIAIGIPKRTLQNVFVIFTQSRFFQNSLKHKFAPVPL